jgi:hypothetical protein
MRATILIALSVVCATAAQSAPLSPGDLTGTWRMSAVSSAKYGCDTPGAMTVVFKPDGTGGLTGVFSGPTLTGPFEQSFVPFASMQTVLAEQSAGGRALTLDAPKSLRRILAVETATGRDGRPAQLEWASVFGGFGEEPSPFDAFKPSAWLTRCPA